MPYLTLELDDVDYAKLRERSQVKRKALRHYAADVLSLMIGSSERMLVVEQEMNLQRFKQSLMQPPEIDALVGQVQALVGDVAPVDFDASTWVVNWLKRPLPALGFRKPEEYLYSNVGFELLTILIGGILPVAFWSEPFTTGSEVLHR